MSLSLIVCCWFWSFTCLVSIMSRGLHNQVIGSTFPSDCSGRHGLGCVMVLVSRLDIVGIGGSL
ncbi:hypothetical protein RND81_06G151500 [Saponaria officinalis]|uniref:Secreted protein n=1 Tax=Saponaria officinalis TaxID=3572 RepID=A0AAW1KBS8_SAPOF